MCCQIRCVLDQIYPSTSCLTPSLSHHCKCLQWFLALVLFTTGLYITHTEAPVRLKVMTCERWESVCCSLSPDLDHSLSFQSLSCLFLPNIVEKYSYPMNSLFLHSLQRSLILPMARIFFWLPGTYLWVKLPEANVMLFLLSIASQSLH